MTKKNLLLLFGIVSFCSVTISGIVLLLKFHHNQHLIFSGMQKHILKEFHLWSSLSFFVFLLTHMFLRRKWIAKNIISTRFSDLNDKAKSLCRNNIICFVLYFLVATTGAIICIIHYNCWVFKELHYQLALVLIFFIIIHLVRHRYPSKNYFSRLK